ncbi:MAG: cell envelope biogenesis protein TolA [Paracoccaceae bacterium]
MNKGVIISGIGHLGLILWVVLGDFLFTAKDMPEINATSVSLLSEAEFDAMMAAAPSTPEPAAEPAVTAPEPVVPEVVEPAPVPEPVVEPAPEPEPVVEPAPEPVVEPIPEPVVIPEPAPEPEPEPAPEVVPEPLLPPAEVEQPIPVPLSTVRPKPRPADRVADLPVEAPDPAVETAPEATPAVSDQPSPDAPVVEEPQVEAAPEEATTQIVTEATETEPDAPQLAPTSSVRPPKRPRKPAAAEEAVAEQPVADAPTETAASDSAATDDAVAEALAAELATAAQTDSGEAAGDNAPKGPPMSSGEKDAMRVAVSSCWNVGALSSEALRVTVVVAVSVGQNGVPDTGSIQMIESSGGSDASIRQAFETARRAIIRCGSKGFPLPPEKYDTWKNMELVFNPEGMRLK